jgi:hypothetical protein
MTPPTSATAFDARPIFYDYDAVMEAVNASLTPDLVLKVKSDQRLRDAQASVAESEAIIKKDEAEVNPKFKERNAVRQQNQAAALEILVNGGQQGARSTAGD